MKLELRAPEYLEHKIEFWLEEHDGEIFLLARSSKNNYLYKILRITQSGLERFDGIDSLGLPTDPSCNAIYLNE